MIESSWLYPVHVAIAIITLIPLGSLLRFRYLDTLVSTNGFWGYDKILLNFSNVN